MKTRLAFAAALAATVATPIVAVAPADARYHGDRYYHGSDRHYRYHCKRSSGTTGGILGAVGGGLIGNALGGGTIGTLAGAGGGALLGRHLDKKHDAAQNRRNGC
ncbi:glycine zipper 2TM domain-containing protein [Sphingomonas morindae]|uniref:Glycine zipper 2TM domain-containing protein n=1 Tax=Sphingomonas morindae TaxID=1541170 RepID=A0ABY4X8I5_9SPHN|nr:glycine zipper 2TM domain-containing protein [Sphingomonas morindae]USI73259.1 glycine zipper 2TM domain-containing protein [Sphingomonas morindae]